MTTIADLTAEYQGWLDANPTVPRLSADEALYDLIDEPPAKRSDALKAQIDWLVDFIDRWEKTDDR